MGNDNKHLVPITPGSIVSLEDARERSVTPSEVRHKILAREEAIRTILDIDRDTYTVPGNDRRALSKAGAEKLACYAPLFGRPAVQPEYEIISYLAEHFKEWDYTVEWYDRKTKERKSETKHARGFYEYTVRCTLKVIGTNKVVGTRDGTCCSIERGKETTMGNTILQQAQKRAFTQAVLGYLAMSDRFTDEETLVEMTSSGELSESGELVMPFGKHKGTPITGVPETYLKWLMENGDTQWATNAQLELQRRAEVKTENKKLDNNEE